MTQITFQDGKPVLRDGKVGTGQGCCCGRPACCQHFCNKMCCNQVKWVIPGNENEYTSVGADCRTTLTLPEGGVKIRLRVRCSGYVYGDYGEKDCDTDCEIVEVEYSADGGTTWTTTPPSAVSGVTWSIYCPDGAAQPESETSAQRCTLLTTLNAEQCAAADGEPCSLPSCPPCGLVCGPSPTEWRLVGRSNGIVWFSGDVIVNPLWTGAGEPFCEDPFDPIGFRPPPSHPKLLLEHFPFTLPYYGYCPYAPAGWPVAGDEWLDLQVLGCSGGDWASVCKYYAGCHTPNCDPVDYFIPSRSELCGFTSFFWSGIGHQLGDGTWGGAGQNWFQSPAGCSCLRDPANGAIVGNANSTGDFCCPSCNQYLGATGCSTGLEYLGHGVAVRFTGAVDNEGSNLWNWEDANGDSPAGFWPSDSTDITIAGELRSWRGPTAYGAGGNYHPNLASLSFPSVTLEPGAVLAISLTTEMLTVDGATIEELMLDGFGVPKACVNGGQYAVGITVTGTATFKNGAENHAVGELTNPYTPYAGITGTCVFESGSKNFGTIAGNCDFSDDASNEGEITGDCTFADTSANNGTITGDATFSGTSQMAGNVTGTATFTGSACHASGTAGTFVPDPPPEC